MLLTNIKDTIRKYGMLKAGDRVLVAVSGGPDSVCLLSALNELATELGISLHVAHLDHMFRGAESAEEALFTRGLADRLNIPATVEQIDVPRFCREQGLSRQAGAREVRYAFLDRAAREAQAAVIATAHTASDQAETFLMRLLRGAGVSGLAAIPPRRSNIVRPLIRATREEVIAYLQSRGLDYVTDPSNAKPLYTRNRVRKEIIPVLSRFNPRIVPTLAAEAALLRDENAAMESQLKTVMEPLLGRDREGITIERAGFNALLPAFQRRLLRKAAGMASGETIELSSVQIEEAIEFMTEAGTGRTIRLPGGLVVEREYGRFVMGPAENPADFSLPLTVPGRTEAVELGLEIESALTEGMPDAGERERINRWQAVFDYDNIDAPLTLRNRRRGDWFCPSGMGGKRKKLQDFFVDRKLPRRRRGRVSLLTAGENILWVVGFRTDERFLPGPGTKRFLTVAVTER